MRIELQVFVGVNELPLGTRTSNDSVLVMFKSLKEELPLDDDRETRPNS